MGLSDHLLRVTACRGIKGRDTADTSVQNTVMKELIDVEVRISKTEIKSLIKMEMTGKTEGGMTNRMMRQRCVKAGDQLC